MTTNPFWLSRPLLNVIDVYRWGEGAGINKMMPPDELHMTIATVREAVSWDSIELHQDELVIPAGPKPVQIFAYTIKALTFSDSRVAARHAEILARYPEMDHPVLRPHVSLYKGGRMPKTNYEGELVLGAERIEEFDVTSNLGIKHIKISDYLADEQNPVKQN